MNLLYQFDEDGFYKQPVFSHDVDRLNISHEYLTNLVPCEFIRARFINGQWVEGADEEYLETIKPIEETSLIDTLMNQNEFLMKELADTKSTNEFLISQQAEMLLLMINVILPTPPIEDNLEDSEPDLESPGESRETDNKEDPAEEESPTDDIPV